MWSKRAILIFLFSAIPTTGFLVARELPFFRLNEEGAQEFLEKGMFHFNSGNFVAAREYFYRSLDVKSDLSLARRFLGDSYYFTGDYESALEQWESLLESAGHDLMIEDRLNLIQHRFTAINDNQGQYRFFGWIRPSRNRFVPVAVQSDEQGNVFVLSYDPPAIYSFRAKFQPVGTDSNFDDFEQNSQITPVGLARFKGPMSFQLYKDRFYIADYAGDQIFILEKNGRIVTVFGETGSGDAQFRGPSGISVSNNVIFVVDQGNRRIQKFDFDGNLLDSWQPEGLTRPYGISAKDSLLAVSDLSGSVFILDEDGIVRQKIQNQKINRPTNIEWQNSKLFIADEKNGPLIFNLETEQFDELPTLRDHQDKQILIDRAVAVYCDPKDRVYIATGNGQVLQISREAALRSSYDVVMYPIETDRYPEIGFSVRVMDRSSADTIVGGLKAENFMIFENGSRVYPLRVNNMTPFQNRMNLVIVKENSKAMEDDRLDQFLDQGINDIISGIRVSDKIKLNLATTRSISVYQGLERRKLISALRMEPAVIDPHIGRSIYEGITDLVDRKGPAGVLLVVSGQDFTSAFDKYDPTLLIQYANAHAIPIHVICFEIAGSRSETVEIYHRLSQETGGEYVKFFDETARKELYSKMSSIKDPRYLVTYRSTGNSSLQGRFIDVATQIYYRKTTGAADGGYFVP
ncbi:MAG: 6-bladed beta-propeller [Leptonema sp. (in: Bacteria)]|nr:6-bladed beta-propeller [Leptonema sp. (in: bacteria)]